MASPNIPMTKKAFIKSVMTYSLKASKKNYV